MCGGHAGKTIVPLLSAASVPVPENLRMSLTDRIQNAGPKPCPAAAVVPLMNLTLDCLCVSLPLLLMTSAARVSLRLCVTISVSHCVCVSLSLCLTVSVCRYLCVSLCLCLTTSAAALVSLSHYLNALLHYLRVPLSLCLAASVPHCLTVSAALGTEVVEAKEGKGSATLSMAVAAHVFLEQVMIGLSGEGEGRACAYVDTNESKSILTFFADQCTFNTDGICCTLAPSASTVFCPYPVLLHLVLLPQLLASSSLVSAPPECLFVCFIASLPLPTLRTVSLPYSVLTFLVTPSPWLTASIAHSVSHSLCGCPILFYCYLYLPLLLFAAKDMVICSQSVIFQVSRRASQHRGRRWSRLL